MEPDSVRDATAAVRTAAVAYQKRESNICCPGTAVLLLFAVGSHLVDTLMMEGHEVIVVDNFFTGQKKNIAHWLHHPLFR